MKSKEGNKPMKKYKRIGSKSVVVIIRISESMNADIETLSESQQLTKSDFVRIAISNAVKFYSKKYYQMKANDEENEQFLRDSTYSFTRKMESDIKNSSTLTEEQKQNYIEFLRSPL